MSWEHENNSGKMVGMRGAKWFESALAAKVRLAF
jgi:hypothetical protein